MCVMEELPLDRGLETMALSTAQLPQRFCRTFIHSSLLLLLSLGWVQPLRTETVMTQQAAILPNPVLANKSDIVSLDPSFLRDFTCMEVSGMSTEHAQDLAMAIKQKNVTLRVDQLHCLALHLSKHLVPKNLDTFPLDMLPFFNPDLFTGSQACTQFFSSIAKANVDVLPRGSPERRRLLLAALTCQGVQGSQVSENNVQALGGLACDLPGHIVAKSAAVVLPRLAACPGPLDQDQQEAAKEALQGGGPPYGPPSRWSVSTLDALQSLLAVLDQSTIHTIPKEVTDAWILHRTSQDPSGPWPELTTILMRLKRSTEEKACPPGRKPQVVDEDLFFYEDWELQACVDGALLASQMDRVNAIPFTYQQLNILKRKLDETYPQGYPESLILRLGHFFSLMSPEDIQKWNVTSLDTLKALLKVSKRPNMDTELVTPIARYLMERGQLEKGILDALDGFYPAYLCALSPKQLGSVPASVLWAARPQDLDSCSSKQLGVLYPRAHLAFQNMSGPEYIGKIWAFLGGASTEDLQALSHQNVSMDMATFKKLPVEAVERLTVAEVQNLLGPHVAGLKAEERNSPVKEWIFQQRQEDLDMLGLGLHGGIPNGYLVLELNSREAFSGGTSFLASGLVVALTPALLMADTLS
ncbi:mesothelin isoform X2 [Heterocephalus glaber]|uniref:Mesothelin n=1 Tax=Heterocephalus glaber TaxID=10181 RepID=A0AAX6QFT0_HETGA|nr:mesothelin isoform X2 [Heterocephalus glaber]